VTSRHRRLRRDSVPRGTGVIGTNLVARVGALVSLSVTSLLVARIAGPEGVGTLTLLRLLPWLTGVLTGCGLYGAAPYFLSGQERSEPRYRPTFVAMAAVAGLVGSAVWLAATPLLAGVFFPGLPVALVAAAAVSVPTQLFETTAKACSQGVGDLAGSNRVIVLEELLFIPVFVALWAAGLPPVAAIVVALPVGDVVTSSLAWTRLRRRGFFAEAGRPSFSLARRIASYGFRAQVGSIVLLLNARLDFAVVAALAGPGPLGVYAVASRYAELLRLPALALNYVLYPAYARAGQAVATAQARAAIPRMGWTPAMGAIPMAATAPLVLPLVFGDAFRDSVVPALILLVGLSAGGVSGVITAFLSADGRPGLSSVAMGAGLVVTVALDVLLIPPFGINGAAVASTVAYLTMAAALFACFNVVTRNRTHPAEGRVAQEPASVGEVGI